MGTYQSFAVTVHGGSHIKHGIVCQDSSFGKDTGDMSIAAVADGHGEDNCFRSDKGAKFAVACAIRLIEDFAELHKPRLNPAPAEGKNLLGRVKGLFEPLLPEKGNDYEKIPLPSSQSEWDKEIHNRLVKHITGLWQVKVTEDYEANPFTPEELAKADEKHRKRYEAGSHIGKAYGATLIASAVTPQYWLGIHIGDGRLSALYEDGSFDQPVPWDEKCFLNATTSICDDDAFERARFYFSLNTEKPPPAAVFLCTDGIDDNYPVDGNEKHLFKLYRTIALTFAQDGFESTCKQLKDLANSFATKGKGDDTSIAGFVDMERLKKAVPLWEKQVKEEEMQGKNQKQEAAETVTAAVTKQEIKPVEVTEAHQQQIKPEKPHNLSNGTFVTPEEFRREKKEIPANDGGAQS